jgi:D-alanyl-D-alanine carboxypeptidase (penicillin-binding protein 5/6)
MDRQDKIITISMIALSALISLVALPETTTHIEAHDAPIEEPKYFENIDLEAKAAYVYDISTNKELFSKNGAQNFPLASLTKIMTAVTASEIARNQPLVVTIDSDSLVEIGDNGLYADERWDLTKILQFMLVVSSNDAASAIANSVGELVNVNPYTDNRTAFVQAMNQKAQDLTFTSLTFSNPSGLDESDTEAGAYGSAQDVAFLLAYAARTIRPIIEPTRYPSFSADSLDGLSHTVPNTDVIIGKIPGMVAGKTGYTALAGGNLAIIFNTGIQHPIAIVVLGSSYEGRFTDMEKLINACLQTIAHE